MALDRARVQQLAANPGTRAALPTSVLQKYGLQKYVQARALNTRLNTPVIQGGQMTGRDLAHAADAAVQAQYGPEKMLYQRQAQQAPVYYNAYANALRQAAAAQPAQAQQTGQAIQALYSSGPQAPGSQQSTVGAAQAGTSNLLGQSETNFLNRLAAGAQSQGIAGRNMALQKGADLAQQMGAANIQERQRLTQQELQNVSTSALAGLNQIKGVAALTTAKAHQTTADALKKKYATAGQPSTVAKPPSNYPGSQADWNNMSMGARQNFLNAHPTARGRAGAGPKGPKPTTGPGSVAPAQENKYVSQINRAAGYLHDGKIPAKDPKTGAVVYQPASQGQIIGWLKAHGADPHVIGVANSLAANNLQGIGQHGIAHAHALGVHVGGRWKIVTAPPRPGAGAPANP